MKRIIFFLTLFVSSLHAAGDPEFVIVIPSYNNERWCEQNMKSCVQQQYPHWKLIYIDDASTDQTGRLVDEYVQNYGLQDRCTIIHNRTNKGALRNIYETVAALEPHKIVVLVDGDDFLATPYALDILAKIYKRGKTWITYGSYVEYPSRNFGLCRRIPAKIYKNNQYRDYRWVTSHLRTFYAALFQKIDKQDLMKNGRFYPTTWDLAIMFPMLEMATKNHITFVKEILYLYNKTNPISDFRAKRQLQLQLDKEIRQKKPYQPLKKLF